MNKTRAGCGYSSILPALDFETYSECGYVFEDQKWKSLSQTTKHGLAATGAYVYAQHESTEILCCAYDLKDGKGVQLWTPADDLPLQLFDYIKTGGLLEAWNSQFEYLIWQFVGVKKLGWPELKYDQLRDAVAKARAFSLPGSLEKAGTALNIKNAKLQEGKRLIKKFCGPRNPSKKDNRIRLYPHNDEEGQLFYDYNIQDVKAELEITEKIPDLSEPETLVWLCDQRMNLRGLHVDVESLHACIEIVKQAHIKYTQELIDITNGHVTAIGQIAKLAKFVGCHSVNAEEVKKLLVSGGLSTGQQRALKIRQILGSASVKKLFAMQMQLANDNRIHGLFQYCGADRTGRWAGKGPQPQNLPSGGPDIIECGDCSVFFSSEKQSCPSCGVGEEFCETSKWHFNAVEPTLELIKSKNLEEVERYFSDPIDAVKGCLRGLYCAAPGHDLICSDYSAIEAVVLAELAGESWRQEVFRSHGKIYEMSASKLTGVSFEDMLQYQKDTDEHHPHRKIGKVAELAFGYGGGVRACLNFGAAHMSNDEISQSMDLWKLGKTITVNLAGVETTLNEIENKKIAWREASPNIVKFWYGLENAAISAIKNPGECFEYREISYGALNNVLYCQLPSGRKLTYHDVKLKMERTDWGKVKEVIYYKSLVKNCWVDTKTYGAKLCENVTQAVARDIVAAAMVRLEENDYPVVLTLHDELAAEVPEGSGSIEQFENLMAVMPHWAAGWPVFARGGWRGKRFRKA